MGLSRLDRGVYPELSELFRHGRLQIQIQTSNVDAAQTRMLETALGFHSGDLRHSLGWNYFGSGLATPELISSGETLQPSLTFAYSSE